MHGSLGDARALGLRDSHFWSILCDRTDLGYEFVNWTIELNGPLSSILQWRLISSKVLSEGSSIIVGPSVVTTKKLSVVHLPLCANCMYTEPCSTMPEPLYAVSIVSSFFVEPGIGCHRASSLSGNILRKVRRGSVLTSAPVSTFKASWSASSMPLDSKSFCNSGCLVPVITCSLSCSSASWLSLNLHFLARNLHLATKS